MNWATVRLCPECGRPNYTCSCVYSPEVVGTVEDWLEDEYNNEDMS